jgi:hypothetical protein
MFAARVAAIPSPSSQRARQGTGSRCRAAYMCVPKISSTSCDQAVLVDQASGVSLPPDAVPVEINRFG